MLFASGIIEELIFTPKLTLPLWLIEIAVVLAPSEPGPISNIPDEELKDKWNCGPADNSVKFILSGVSCLKTDEFDLIQKLMYLNFH